MVKGNLRPDFGFSHVKNEYSYRRILSWPSKSCVPKMRIVNEDRILCYCMDIKNIHAS